MRPREETLAWEARWAAPAGLASLGGIVLIAVAIGIATQGVGGGDGESELLRNVDANRGAQLTSNILQAIGVALLAAPLYYLFRAANARSEAMRGQLVGVVVAAPLFLGALAVLSGVSTLSAASEFVSEEVPRLVANGVELNSDRADEVANETISEAPLRSLAAGFGLGGQLGFVIGMFYTAMHAMRTGLLTRFWGSLGMALGIVSIFFFQFALLWYVYVGLVILGWVPGGRPPAWRTGEAMPWPTPGERAGADLGGEESGELPDEFDEFPDIGAGEERRKRKQRE